MGITGVRALWPAAAVFAADQLAKGLVVVFVAGPLAVAPFLNIVLVHNTGAAFGFLNRSGDWSNILFMVIAVVVSVIIVRMLRGPAGRDPQIALALQWILGGALGNLFDRIVRGAVVDFIDFYVGDWHWFTFNTADVAIALGAALLVADALGWRLIGAGGECGSDGR